MRTVSQGMAWCGLVGIVSSGGCVGLAEHDAVKMSNRTLQAELEQCRLDSTDARNGSETLRSQIKSLEGELATKNQLVSSLQQENDRLHDAFRKAQGALENIASTPMQGPILLESKLPPELDTALKRFSERYPNEVSYDAKRGFVKWKSDLVFALGSDVVKDSALDALRSFASIIKSNAAADFELAIVGHTDNRPIKREATAAAHPTNWHLSAHRAIAVSNVLQNDGYESKRIGIMGYGEFRPIASNDGEEGRTRNRRVEIYLIPRGALVAADSAGVWQLPEARLALWKAPGISD